MIIIYEVDMVKLGTDAIGFIALALSVFISGSVNLAVKQFETGDGLFYQMMFTTGIWCIGFVLNCVRRFPTFYALPMLGGFLWTTGNLNTVPIIKLIGVGLFSLISNTIVLVIGWAVARFGNIVYPDNK